MNNMNKSELDQEIATNFEQLHKKRELVELIRSKQWVEDTLSVLITLRSGGMNRGIDKGIVEDLSAAIASCQKNLNSFYSETLKDSEVDEAVNG